MPKRSNFPGAASSFTIVPVAVPRPMLQFTGEKRFTKKLWSGSLLLSPRTDTVNTWLVLPAGNVTVLVVAMKSFGAVAVPLVVRQEMVITEEDGLDSVTWNWAGLVPVTPSKR